MPDRSPPIRCRAIGSVGPPAKNKLPSVGLTSASYLARVLRLQDQDAFCRGSHGDLALESGDWLCVACLEYAPTNARLVQPSELCEAGQRLVLHPRIVEFSGQWSWSQVLSASGAALGRGMDRTDLGLWAKWERHDFFESIALLTRLWQIEGLKKTP